MAATTATEAEIVDAEEQLSKIDELDAQLRVEEAAEKAKYIAAMDARRRLPYLKYELQRLVRTRMHPCKEHAYKRVEVDLMYSVDPPMVAYECSVCHVRTILRL